MPNNGMKGVNKAIATVNAVVKKGTKLFVKSLPLMTIVGNVAISYSRSPTNLGEIVRDLGRRYTGFDIATGAFNLNEAGAGAGSLIGATVVSGVLNAFT